MDLDTVKKICKGLGNVQKFNENSSFFGNIELEIRTPNNTELYIVSDRGEFLCYVKKKRSLQKLVSLSDVINNTSRIQFNSLKSVIDYLKSNIHIIETHM